VTIFTQLGFIGQQRAALRGSVATAALSLAMLAGTASFAQSTAGAAEEADSEFIVVTGSRIARPNVESVAPVTVVGAEVFRDQGAINVEQVLNQLPQIAPGLNANTNNGGNGTVSVDVRGLGSERTLVLINGRRMVPSNNTGVVDLNVINPQLIKRVDVVTGGASSVYGSDALGGVVNFILKDDFEGVELTSQYGVTGRGDSTTFSVGGLIGGNFADDRGNVIAAVSYTDRAGSFQRDRDWSRIDQNGGSATGIAGRFDNLFNNPFVPGGNRAFDSAGNPRPFVNNFDLTGVTDRYNFAPVNYLQTPQKRFTLTALASYDINDKVELFGEAFYVNSRVNLQLAETPATNIFVDPNSPVLSPAARALAASRPNPTGPLVFRRRMAEVGPRIQNYDFNVTQLNFGVRGALSQNWDYELYYGYGRVSSSAGLQNDVSRLRLTAGLNGCPVGSPAGCVPVNAFGAGNISPAAVDYIRIASAVDTFNFGRDNVVGTLTGTLATLPAGALGVSIGAEYRRDSSEFVPSDPAQTGDLTGFNAVLPISGNFDTKEIFGEAVIPILADTPFFEELTAEVGARYADFSSVGGNFTWKAGGTWVPIKAVRLRGVYSRAVRAPSVFELFQAGDQAFPAVVDPCFRGQPTGERPAPSAGVATICQLQGLPDPRTNVLVQTNSQIEATLTGSSDLREETSDTLTLGMVLAPPSIPSLTFSVDYFDIRVNGYVERIAGGTQGLVTSCFASGVTTTAQLASDPFCSLLSRRLNGDLLATVPLTNEFVPGVDNRLKTRGIDFAFGYDIPMGFIGAGEDRIALTANVTHLIDYEFNGTQFAGFASGDFGTFPKWRATTRANYVARNFTAGLTWRYIGNSRDSFGDIGGDPEDFGPIGALSYFDINVSARIGETFEIFGGITNLLDKDPPAVNAGFTTTNTDELLYDVLGRRFFIGGALRF
jgi:iron complex outermembrane recepter protein